jgi:hypothetical protein
MSKTRFNRCAQFIDARLACEMQCLYDAGAFVDGNIRAMAGHEDGIIGFGFDAAEAGEVVLRYLHIARAQS